VFLFKKIKDDLTNTQIKPIHIKKILEWRKNDKIAHAFLCELLDPKVHQSQQQLRKKFLLPESELIIDKYHVSHNGSPGFLVLSSSYVLFDAYYSNGPDSDYQLAILLLNITNIKREKVLLFDLIKLSTTDGEVYSFFSHKNREYMVQAILEVARLTCNKIIPYEQHSRPTKKVT